MKVKKNIRKILLLMMLLIISIPHLQAQSSSVKGTIIDNEGAPIPGANITIKGTNKGTVSDADGAYTIGVSTPTDVLVFSFIGYTVEEIQVNDQTVINVKLLPDITSLNEVVVMGYSDKKKNEITSAVSVISAEKMKGISTNDVGNMIQGKIAGVQVSNSTGQPGEKASIHIRGISTITGTPNPLYVVDGVVSGNSDPGIDPNAIENVTILKDAGATGMYGSRANSGVVIITTKSGNSEKTEFEFNVTRGMKTANFGNVQMMNGQQYYDAHKLYYLKNNGKPDMVRFNADYSPDLENRNFDWVNEAFSPAYYSSYNFSVSRKAEKNKYYIGATYTSDEGTFLNTSNKNFSLYANNSIKMSDRVNLTANVSMNVNKTFSTAGTDDLMYIFLASPWDSAYDKNGNIKYVDKTTKPWYSRAPSNPLDDVMKSENSNLGASMDFRSSLNVKLTSFLSFVNNVSGSVSGSKNTNIILPERAGQYNKIGDFIAHYSEGYGGGLTSLLKFNQSFGDHNISGLVGGEFGYGWSDFTNIHTNGLPSGSTSIAGTSIVGAPDGYLTEEAMNSFISQANYSYLDRYFITGSYRIDKSSKFAPNKKTAAFPTVGFSWLLSQEGFMRDITWLDLLKVRTSLGFTGNNNIQPSQYLALYTFQNGGVSPLQAANNDLSWERTRQENLGIEINLFKRIDLTFELYNNTTFGLLFQVDQPLESGFATQWQNAGNMVNKGIEFNMSTVNFKSESFTWSTDFNISYNVNEVISGITQHRSAGNVQIIVQKGLPAFEYFLPKWAGVDPKTGDPLWEKVTVDSKGNSVPLVGANGKVETTTVYDGSLAQAVGSPLPKYQGGFVTKFTYKNISLSSNLTFIGGNKVYNGTMSVFESDGNEPRNNFMNITDLKRWEKPGDNADLPKFAANGASYYASSRFLEDGSYVKINNIMVSYSLPEKWLRGKLQSAVLSLGVDNVYTWFKAHAFDPESYLGNDQWTLPGQLYFNYPKSRQYNVILNVKF